MISDYCGQGRVWRNLKINDEDHAICITKENESWKVFLTNLIEIWTEILTDEIMFHKCQTMNPLLSFEAFDWKQLVLDMLNDIPQYVHKNILEVTTYRIELHKKENFGKLRFSLDLLKGTPEQLWESITMPLCLSSMELMRRHQILLDLVKQKDEEIAEYKAEGAKLIRKYIATKPFNEELFHIDDAGAAITDFVNTFQSVLHFYNEIYLPKLHVKPELEVSLNSASGTNGLKIDENVLPDLRTESVQSEQKQDELTNDEQMHSKVEECKTSPSSSKTQILRISNTSHTIHKVKKNKKTLNIL
ncbi:uncharacterized protein LOC114253721 [Monomorium pharaonis]|uniref:uncharacterized protein LOC114253721 n=1 Tax=Monomorium pharaonis TaxID=307658 RepID=UPI00102E1F05|nr:uncharacterized protein LOC114253721 [Monomorium pharaonis]